MKKTHLLMATALTVGVTICGAAAVHANNNKPDRPAWVTADGKADLNKMPDDAKIPYQCWSGKMVTLEGKAVKQKEKNGALPGSTEHQLGMAKTKELRQVPGAVTYDAHGGEVLTIDDANPEVQKIMKKYEAKENPQCR